MTSKKSRRKLRVVSHVLQALRERKGFSNICAIKPKNKKSHRVRWKDRLVVANTRTMVKREVLLFQKGSLNVLPYRALSLNLQVYAKCRVKMYWPAAPCEFFVDEKQGKIYGLGDFNSQGCGLFSPTICFRPFGKKEREFRVETHVLTHTSSAQKEKKRRWREIQIIHKIASQQRSRVNPIWRVCSGPVSEESQENFLSPLRMVLPMLFRSGTNPWRRFTLHPPEKAFSKHFLFFFFFLPSEYAKKWYQSR